MAYERESKEAIALKSLQSKRYPDANKDFVKNMRRLNSAVDYMSAYMQQMQKGIDDANQNFIEQIQSFIQDLIVMFAGGEPTGIEFGDLKFIVQGLGALFGLNGPFPLSLLNAAQHFFLGFVVPLPQFTDVVFDAIFLWAEELGLDEDFVNELKELQDAFDDLTETIQELFDSVSGLLDVFGVSDGNFGPLGMLWDAIFGLFENVDTSGFADILDLVTGVMTPFIDALTHIINVVNAVLGGFSGGLADIEGILNFASIFDGINFLGSGFDPVGAVIDMIGNIFIPNGLLGNGSPLNALNLFNTIDLSRLPLNIPKINISGLVSDLATFLTGSSPLDASKLFNTIGIGRLPLNIPKLNIENLIPDLDDLAENAKDIINSAVNGLAGLVGDGFSWTTTDLKDKSASLAASVAQTAQAIAELQQDSSPEANAGNSLFADFSTYTAGPVTAPFTPSLLGAGTGIVEIGPNGQGRNQLQLTKGNGGPRQTIVYCDSVTLGDFQKITVVFAGSPSYFSGGFPNFGYYQANDFIFGRVGAAYDGFVYAGFGGGQVWVGYNYPGGGGPGGIWKQQAHSFQAGAAYSLVCGTSGGSRVYRVLCNGVPILTHTEVGTFAPLGANFRKSGFSLQSDGDFGPNFASPSTVAAFAMQDNVIPTYLGTTMRVFRANTGGAAASTGATLAAPGKIMNNFYDSVDYITNDLTFTPGTNCRIVVSKTGLYWFHAAVRGNNTNFFALGAWVNGVFRKWGMATNYSSAQEALGGVMLYLNAGDYVELGYRLGGSAISFVGDATGTQTFMELHKVA